MEKLDEVVEETLFAFSLPQPEPIGIPVLQVKEVAFSYSGKEQDFLFDDVNIGIDMDTRITLLGVNGAGNAKLTHTTHKCIGMGIGIRIGMSIGIRIGMGIGFALA